MYDYCHNKLPNSFNSTYKYNHEIQTLQRTRQSDLIYISRCRSNFAQNLPLIKFPQIWNKWVQTKFQLLLRPAFKMSAKSKLLSTYQSTVRCTNTHCSSLMKLVIKKLIIKIIFYIFENFTTTMYSLLMS